MSTTEELTRRSAADLLENPAYFLEFLIRNAIKHGSSDIHLKSGAHPYFRISSVLTQVKSIPVVNNSELEKIAALMMDETQKNTFKSDSQTDLAYEAAGTGRVRANIFKQKGKMGVVMRVIPSELPDPSKLNLPPIMPSFASLKRGLVLVTGATGSGKSTTLATLIEHINLNFSRHIVTIEDPIEFSFTDQFSIISQREVGIDTNSFSAAMHAALRQDPDVILIGELRNQETIETAVKASDTGHLVLSTLHASGCIETINRLLANFSGEQKQIMRRNLATNLKGIISQRLLPTADGKGLVCAHEVLVVTKTVQDMIEDPERIGEIDATLRKGQQHGMISFDDCLFDLVERELITSKTAMAHASNATDLRLKLEGY